MSKSIEFAQNNDRLNNLCGNLDEHIRLIERRCKVEIANRGAHFQVSGNDEDVDNVIKLLTLLFDETQNKFLTLDDIHLAITELNHKALSVGKLPSSKNHIINTKRGQIRGRGEKQCEYLHHIATHDINFGIGPAGTGKSFLAVASAVEALERDEVRRIILVRPAVEAGERLGFLPGDLVEKIDPYLRPLYDALYEMLGFDLVHKFIERHTIEIAPLAFMRGRTLNDAFIILDEAQNTTIEQMKMFLTRIGFGSTAVITGDTSQVDLPKHIASGLKHAVHALKNVDGISISYFSSKDVVRHPLVAQIINAYEKVEKEEKHAIVNRPSK